MGDEDLFSQRLFAEARRTRKDWLQKRISIEEAEAQHLVRGYEWQALLDMMAAGDELWEFSSSSASWQSLAGCAGVALLREGEIIAAILTVMS